MDEDLKRKLSEVTDPSKLFEERLETLSEIIISIGNHERLYKERSDKLQNEIGKTIAINEGLKSMETRIATFLTEVKSLRSQVRDDKTSVDKMSEKMESLISDLESKMSHLEKISDGIQINLRDLKSQNKSSEDTLSRSTQLEERLKGKLDKLNALSVELTKKLFKLESILSKADETSTDLTKLRTTYDELCNKLRKHLEESNLRISRIEKIEANNVNAAELYEKVYREYIDKENERLNEIADQLNAQIENVNAALTEINGRKSCIEEFMSSHGMPLPEDVMTTKFVLENMRSKVSAHEAQIDHLNNEFKEYEEIRSLLNKIKSNWFVRILLRLNHSKPF